MSTKQRMAWIGVGAAVAVAIGVVLWGQFEERPSAGALADKMREYLAVPASGMTMDYAPGTLLRVATMTPVALPAQAYANPAKLDSGWQPLMQSGRFEDSLDTEGTLAADILAFLGHSGSRQEFRVKRVAAAVTEIQGLERKDVTEVQLMDATLRPDLAQKYLASGEGVVVVQTLFKAKSMKVAYRDGRGVSVALSLPQSTLPGNLNASRSVTTTGVEEYTDVILGYKPWFIAGGQGSPMTKTTADALVKTLSEDKGYTAKAIGNLVLVEATPATALQLSRLTQAAVAQDEAKAAGDPARATEINDRRAEMVRTMPLKRELTRPRARAVAE